jgi:hypothetical protein
MRIRLIKELTFAAYCYFINIIYAYTLAHEHQA